MSSDDTLYLPCLTVNGALNCQIGYSCEYISNTSAAVLLQRSENTSDKQLKTGIGYSAFVRFCARKAKRGPKR